MGNNSIGNGNGTRMPGELSDTLIRYTDLQLPIAER